MAGYVITHYNKPHYCTSLNIVLLTIANSYQFLFIIDLLLVLGLFRRQTFAVAVVMRPSKTIDSQIDLTVGRNRMLRED
jgi:hypothetical protein